MDDARFRIMVNIIQRARQRRRRRIARNISILVVAAAVILTALLLADANGLLLDLLSA